MTLLVIYLAENALPVIAMLSANARHCQQAGVWFLQFVLSNDFGDSVLDHMDGVMKMEM